MLWKNIPENKCRIFTINYFKIHAIRILLKQGITYYTVLNKR